MEIILTQDVDNLGSRYDLVKVRPGYARNFLIPRGMAQAATPSNRKSLAETVKQRAHKEEKLKKDAEASVAKLKGLNIQVAAKTGENGKIFGSVTSVQLAEAINKAGVHIERKNIDLKSEHIKTVGKYTANVRLHKEITAEVTFEVVSE
jgi:large subunit ribosomal protein L9